MSEESREIDFERDVAFTPDIKGPSLLVSWRGVPVGFVRPLERVPKLNPNLSSVARAELRAEYRERIGKWSSIQLSQWYDTKEEAARQLIAKAIAGVDGSLLMQATLRNDAAEVERLLSEIRDRVQLATEET